jgi:hypothetical protein
MPADPPPIREFPCLKRTGVGHMMVWTLTAAVVVHRIIRAFTHPSVLNTSILVGMLVCVAFVLIVHFCKPDESPTFYISETHAGFGNSCRDPSAGPFASVTECLESPSSLNLVHEAISVPIGIELRRHDFALEDWEVLTSLLIQRVRQHAPLARVRTLFDPPDDD